MITLQDLQLGDIVVCRWVPIVEVQKYLDFGWHIENTIGNHSHFSVLAWKFEKDYREGN